MSEDKVNYKDQSKKYLNLLLKIISVNDRVVIGRLKCIDNLGNLFLSETVEAFDKKGDYNVNFDLYKNGPEHLFSFESETNQYQIYSPCIVPKDQIKQILILKQ